MSQDKAPSTMTAVILPSSASSEIVLERIQEIRQSHDRAFKKWPPHVTCIPPQQLPMNQTSAAEIAAVFRPIADVTTPFTVTFDRVSVFRHKRSSTIVLEPSSRLESNNLRMLQRAMKAALPSFTDVPREKHDFRPHLTLATVEGDDPGPLCEQIKQIMIQGLTFVVDRITLMVKNHGRNEVYQPTEEVLFATNATAIPSTSAPSEPKEAVKISVPRRNACFAFIAEDEAWGPVPDITVERPAPRPSRSSTKFLTYNVLTDHHHPTNHLSEIRHPVLLETIVRADADIVALQECDSEFASLLLSSDDIRESYHVSEIDCDALPTSIMLLSRDKFTHRTVSLSVGKKAVIAHLDSGPVIAVVHLTSDYSANKSQLRLAQWRSLLQHLSGESHVVVLGDFNAADGDGFEGAVVSAGFVDCWLKCHPGVDGWTFDPVRNSLADVISRRRMSGKRYDRVLIRAADNAISECMLVGVVDDDIEFDGSDHFGLSVTIANDNGDAMSVQYPTEEGVTAPLLRYEDIASDIASEPLMGEFLKARGVVPDEATFRRQTEALDVLQGIMATVFAPSPFRLEPVGSFALGTASPSSDIDVLCVGLITVDEFFAMMRGREDDDSAPRVEWPAGCRLLQIVGTARVPIVQLLINDTNFDLAYCRLPLPVPDQRIALDTFLSMYSQHIPPPALQTLCSRIDLTQVVERVGPESLPAFRVALRFLKLWAEARGVNKLGGFPGSHALTLLLARVVARRGSPVPSLESVRLFFEFCSEHQWDAEGVGWAEDECAIRVDERTPMVVASPASKLLNVTRHAVASSREVWVAEARRAAGLVDNMDAICQEYDVKSSHEWFLRFNMSAANQSELHGLVAHLRFRLVSLIVSIQRRCPAIGLRVYPKFWTLATTVPEDEITSASFLIGLFKRAVLVQGGEKQQAVTTFKEVCSEFEDSMRRSAFFTDSMWFEVVLQDQSGVTDLTPLTVDLTLALHPSDTRRQDAIDPESDAFIRSEEIDGDTADVLRSMPTEKRGTKLRSSADVINRILWDRRFDPKQFVVGYLDRFTGMQEMPLMEFVRRKADQQGEEWIPFHRVYHFKRLLGGGETQCVWDRKAKLDRIF